MKITIFILAIFTLILLPRTLPAETSKQSLSLRECISTAMKNASSVVKAENNLHLQGTDVLKGYGSFLPGVSASATYTPLSVSRSYSTAYTTTTVPARITTESETLNLAITTSLNLFNGFRDHAALRSALDRQTAAGFSLSRARQIIAFDITQNYYQVLLDKELLGIAREKLQSARDLLTLTDRQFLIGLKSSTDLYQQQAEVGNNELSVIRAETQFHRSTLELLRRLRLEPLTEITLEPVDTALLEALPPSPDLRNLVLSSLEKRADLKAKARETEAARWEVTRASGSRWPKLDLNFTVDTGGTGAYKLSSGDQSVNYLFPSLREQLENGIGYTLSLRLNWTIFDGFLTSYNIESARVARMNQQLDYEELKNNIVIDLQQAVGDYRAALTQIGTARMNLKAAQSAYDGVQRKYELGAAGFVELSTARTTLYNAKSNLTQAAYNIALQKNILDFTTGATLFE